MKKIFYYLREKWHVYLIEMLVIIFSILMAFWLNNWSEDKRERSLEKQYITSLLEDLNADVESLEAAMLFASWQDSCAARIIHVLLDKKATVEDTTGFLEDFQYAGYLGFFDPHSSTFDDLKSTGNIRLLHNLKLKKKLNAYYTDIKANSKYESLWEDKVWGEYWTNRDRYFLKSLKSFWSGSYDIETPDFSRLNENANSLIQSLYIVRDMMGFRQTVYQSFKKSAEEIVALLNAELT